MSETDTNPAAQAQPGDPFDSLAEHAIAEYRAGRTRTLEDFAEEHGIDLVGADGRAGETHDIS